MREFLRDMHLANLSSYTIEKRVEMVERFRAFLGEDTALLDATTAQLRSFQATFEHKEPATVDVYTRHLKAFFRWAYERELIATDPATKLITPRLPKRRPHPWSMDEARVIFAHTLGMLRLVFVLAAFVGLRRGEICRIRRSDLDMGERSMLVHGKGGKERMEPLLPPVMEELSAYGLPRSGYIVTEDGRMIDPDRLSTLCSRHLQGLGLETTLHSGRHFYGTQVARTTKDPLLVQYLLGHETLQTSMNYIETDTSELQQRLAGFAAVADEVRTLPRLRVIDGEG